MGIGSFASRLFAALVACGLGHAALAQTEAPHSYKGTVPCAALPALTGDATTTAGACATTGVYHFIATLTASSSASLNFSGANWSSSYKTLFLNCAGILSSTASANLHIYVGEGGGPTWETGATYTVSNIYNHIGSASVIVDQTTTGVDVYDGGLPITNTVPFMILFYIDNVSSSSIAKLYNGAFSTESTFYAGNFGGYWNADTNPITGLQVIPDAGTIASGTCSLYGIN